VLIRFTFRENAGPHCTGHGERAPRSLPPPGSTAPPFDAVPSEYRPAGCGSCPATCSGHLRTLPGQSGYHKRLRAAVPLLKRAIRAVAQDTVRPLPPDGPPLRVGRLGRLRPLPVALPVVLVLRLHLVCTLAGAADHLGAGQPQRSTNGRCSPPCSTTTRACSPTDAAC